MTRAARARYAGYRFPAEIISHAVWLYFRFPLGQQLLDHTQPKREPKIQSRRVAVFSVPAWAAYGRGVAGRPRHHRQPRNGAAMGAQIWPAVRQPDPSSASAGWRQMASR